MSLSKKEIAKRYREAHPEKVRESRRRYRKAHPEKVRESERRYYKTHRAKVIERTCRYHEAHPEKHREEAHRYSKTHPEKIKANHHRRRCRERNAPGGSFEDYELKMLYAEYDHRCLKCGRQIELTPDHVIPLAHGGAGSIDNIQPLCLDCNVKKGARHHTDYRTRPPLKVEQFSFFGDFFGAIEP